MFEWRIHDRRFHIREAQTAGDYEAVEELQREAWGFADIDIVPGDMLVASQHAGGLVLCAFEGERMIGFAFGFPALEDGALSIHSHMLAVRQQARNLQAGFYLKFAQRARALAMGINEITWTFDPLQSLNAHLNFGKLGVIARRYFVNFYGEETSSPLHRGFGTDRLWVSWQLQSERVKSAIERLTASQESPPQPRAPLRLTAAAAVLVRAAGIEPQLADDWRQRLTGDECFIEIPHDINALKEAAPELGRRWREATREAFLAAIEARFTVRDFLQIEATPEEDSQTGERRRRWVYRLSR